MSEALHEHIVMTDSDIRFDPVCLQTVVSELSQPGVALVTCPYLAVGGPGLWSRLEALGLNTDFLAGMLTQRLLNGMDFAIGCTLATRRGELSAIGGLEYLERFLAEDFMMGNLMHRLGRRVILSRSVIEHYIGNDPFLVNWGHRLRWARSTRRSRRAGYLGEIFTKPTVIALLVLLIKPAAWPLAVVAFAFRMGAALSTAVQILHDPQIRSDWWLLAFEDLSSFLTWCLGFFGNTIVWRGRKLSVAPDGTLDISP